MIQKWNDIWLFFKYANKWDIGFRRPQCHLTWFSCSYYSTGIHTSISGCSEISSTNFQIWRFVARPTWLSYWPWNDTKLSGNQSSTGKVINCILQRFFLLKIIWRLKKLFIFTYLQLVTSFLQALHTKKDDF